MADIFQSIDALEPEARQRIIDRLELRAQLPQFAAMRERYFAKLDFSSARRVIDLGCGTGASTRAIIPHLGPGARLVGSDLSADLIAEANKRAEAAGISDRVSYEVSDSHDTGADTGSYDIVIAHTLMSHVKDSAVVLAETARLARPGGTIAVFDGDYASITLGYGDRNESARMVEGMLKAIVANPFVMRSLATVAANLGLRVKAFLPELLAEVGEGPFFASMLNAYIPAAIAAGAIDEADAAQWHQGQLEASKQGELFGSCNFYTYLFEKPA